MKILLVSRIDNRDALDFAEKISTVLKKNGSDVVFDSDTAKSLGCAGFPLADANADVVLVVGGGWHYSPHYPADGKTNSGHWSQLGRGGFFS